MAVYKDKKGKWYVNTSYYEDGKRVYITKRGFNLKKQALEWEILNKNKSEIKYADITYFHLAFEIITNKQAKDKNKKESRRLHEMYMKEFLNKRYSGLTKPKINKWYNEIYKLDLSTSHKNKIIREFKRVCKYANDVYDLYDYGKSLTLFKYKVGEKEEMQVWTIEDFNKFIDYVDNYIMKAFFTFLFFTGCRRGEALALTPKDFNLPCVTFKQTKNISSERTVELNKRIIDIITPLMNNNFVFGGLKPLSYSTIQRHFKKSIKDSGVKSIRLHDLRHSHATILINQGINIVAVSKRLGHANTSMTLNVYTHLLEKNNDELMEYLNEL